MNVNREDEYLSADEGEGFFEQVNVGLGDEIDAGSGDDVTAAQSELEESYNSASDGEIGPEINSQKLPLSTSMSNPLFDAVEALQPHPHLVHSLGEQRPEFLKAPLVHEAFETAAAQNPDAQCLHFNGQWITYAKTSLKVSQLAAYLQREGGVAPGVVVALMLERSLELVISILAILKAGGCYLPCDPSYPDERLKMYLEDAGVMVVIAQPQQAQRARDLVSGIDAAATGIKIINPADAFSIMSGNAINASSKSNTAAAAIGPEDPAYIIFTSGSTGRPKGVVIPHRSLRDHVLGTVEHYSMTSGDTSLLSITINFDPHLTQTLPPLIVGGRLVISRPTDHMEGKYITDLIARENVTHVATTPSLALVQFRGPEVAACTSLRCILIGGEAMQREVIDLFAAKLPSCRVFNVYGPTEAGISAVEGPCPPSTDIITLGRPIYNMHTYVVDSELRHVAVGVPGELLLSGPRLALHYAGQPELTAEKFIPNPCIDLVSSAGIDPSLASFYCKAYRTGDLVRWCSDGTLEYLGRIDRQVKVMGVRIELGEVENALSAAPGVVMAVATLRIDPRDFSNNHQVKRLVGWVMPSTVDPLKVLQHCALSLVPAAVPVDVVALDAFPTTANGKVDFEALPDPPSWHALPAMPSSNMDTADDQIDEAIDDDDEVSKAVKLAWKEVLGEFINLEPSLDFFSRGGTSLDVMRSNAAIADSLGLAHPLQTTLIYKTRTLEATIAAIRELYLSNNEDTASSSPSGKKLPAQRTVLAAEVWPDATRPLSAGQEQMWTLATLTEPQYTSAYVVAAAFRIVGSLDVAKLQQALTIVASRHEVLRMRYAMVGKSKTLSGFVSMADVYKVNLRTVLLENDENRKVQEALKEEFSLPWDLEAGPLMRAALIQPPALNFRILCIALHHAVSDDWSMAVFCRELSVAYKFLISQKENMPDGTPHLVPLNPLPVQYADFAAWQKKKSPLEMRAQLEYWRNILKGAPQVLQLPTDYPRPLVPSLQGSTLSSPNLSLPVGLLQQLRDLASKLQISLAALMLAAFHTLLAKICDTQDVVVGVPVAQRGLSAVQQLIGYFITPVAVRASLHPDSSFEDVAHAVQSALAGAMDNSDIPFQDIVQGLGLGTVKRSHTPVFQVMFNFTDDPELSLDLSDSLEIMRLPIPDLGTSQFELTMSFAAGYGTGSMEIEYSTSIFKASTVSSIVDSYKALLSSIVASPEAPVRKIDMISEAQRAELAALSAGPDRKDLIYGPLVHQQFATKAAVTPKAPCLLFTGGTRTYGAVAMAVDLLAARLADAGVRPSFVVGVMVPRSPALVIAMLATMKVGGVYLPLDTSLAPGRLASYIKEAAPAVVLVADAGDAKAVLAALPCQLQRPAVIKVENHITMDASNRISAPQVQLDGNDVAALVFAAGPAGRPYGVELTHAGLRDLVGWTYNESTGASAQDIYAFTMPVSSSSHIATVLAALAGGAAVAILPPGMESNADAVASFCVSTKTTILEQTPIALERYLPRLKAVAPQLDIRAVILRGELPKPSLIAAFKEALPFAKDNIVSMYGMNEFGISACTCNLGYVDTKITLGMPDPNVQVYIVHPEDLSRLQPVGVRGELLLTGVRLARGYWKNPEMTNERFLPNPFLEENASKAEVELFGRVYRTGDLVSWDREGQLCYHGFVNPNANKVGVRFGEQDGKNLSAEDKAEVARFALGEERRKFFTRPLVHEAFEAVAASSPTQKCLCYERQWLTYGDVASRSAALAIELNALGVGPGVPVGIMLDRSFDLIISILAVFRAGGCYVPCDPSFPDGRLLAYLEDSKATVILTHTKDTARARAMINNETVQVIDLADLNLNDKKRNESAALDTLKRAGPEDPAYIIFTSGSTGRPKGVVIPHRSLRDHVLGTVEHFSMTSGDTSLLSIVINFDPHLTQIVPPLVVGARLVITRPDGHTDPEYISTLIASENVTHFATTPSLALVQFRGPEVAACTSLRCVLIGGEAMQREVIDLFAAKLPSCRVFNVYGPTEAGISAVEGPCPPSTDIITLGRPIYNMHTYVVDSELRPVAVGVPGELLLSGPRLALHYAGLPELTAEKFIPNPCIDLVSSAGIDPSLAPFYRKAYRTGDLVRWCSDGTLEYLGRIDRQVKVMGVRIELGEVENALSAAPGVTSAVVIAVASGADKILIGFVTPETVNTDAAFVHCRNTLVSTAVPSKLITLESLPLLLSGKADLKALEELASLDANSNVGTGDGEWYVPPSTDLEVAITRAWQEVLQVPEDEISVQADFFSVGGNSLKAGILTSHLRSTLNMPRLQATTVYTGKSVRGMAALIEKTHSEEVLNEEKLNQSRPFLKRLTNPLLSSTSRSTSIVLHPHADDIGLELLSSEAPTRLPYWVYLISQWLMLALLSTVQPIMWGALLAMLFEMKHIVGWGGVIGLWPVMRILSLILNAILLLVLKWVLVGRLKPGVYPLYGWMYARWVTMRALHSQMSTMLLPILKRTSLLPWLLRGLGAKIESPSTTLIETVDISDFDLITLGKGSCIYHAAVVTGAFVAPAGYLRRDPVLVLSPVVIGERCHIGCNAVVSAGTTIPDNHNLKPHASPAHPGDAPVAGPLSDHPHFTPEERLPTIVNLASGLLAFIWEALVQEPAVALALYLIAVIIGRVPLLEGLGANYEVWQLAAFGALFGTFYRIVSPATGMVAQALAVYFWKWCVVGRMNPGRNLAKSKLSLFNYSVLRRLVENQRWTQLQEVLAGTPAMAAIYRSLGAKIGRQVFLGGLTVVEFDALTIHDSACSGSCSRVLAADDDGIIEQVVIRGEATIGNMSTLYPGCDIGERAVIGNDTPICKDRTVPLDTRVMGSIQYSVGRRRKNQARDGSDKETNGITNSGPTLSSSLTSINEDAEVELGLPSIVKDSASGVDTFDVPLWHSVLVVVVLLIVEPIAPVIGWLPVATIITLLQSGYIYLIIVAYPILVTIGWVLAIITLRLMLELSGIRKLWAAGSAPCFDLRLLVIHSWFSLSPSGLNALNGTPFMVWIFRALGFTVGSGAVILGHQPREAALVSIGENSVLEAQAILDGHYLEFARFIFNPVTVGKACWVQEGARVMPATELKDGSRVLPASLVLPGDTLEKDMIWGGLPAEPLGPRPHSKAKNPKRKLLRSGRIGGSTSSSGRSSGKKSTGMSGFLGSLASANQQNSAERF